MQQAQALTRQANEMAASYNTDVAAVNAMIEQAHKLPAGAIGKTHAINLETMVLDLILTPQEVTE
jgi:hypothetical protein